MLVRDGTTVVGMEVGSRRSIVGNPVLPTDVKSKLKTGQCSIHLPRYDANLGWNRNKVRREWRRIRPTILFVTHIDIRLRQVLEKMVSGRSIEGIISTSMMLLPSERAFIEKFIGVKVCDRYGCEEVPWSPQSVNARRPASERGAPVCRIPEGGRSDASDGEPGKIIVKIWWTGRCRLSYQVEDVGFQRNESAHVRDFP